MARWLAGGRLVLPADDRATSPFTGYTREHWLAAADGVLEAAQVFASPGRSQISPPGRPSRSGQDSDGLEGFARTFLLLAFRAAGSNGTGPGDALSSYAEGLAAGADPGHPEAWPRIDADCRQALVEAYAIATGLHLTRPWLWNRLDDRVRQRAVDWLHGAFGLEIPDNNWHLFRMIVGDFLASVGAPHDRAEMDADRARIEEFYVGDGWYRDGPKDAFDHYCGWAMHTKYVLWATMFDPDALPVLRERLHAFLDDFGWFFGADGAPLHQGRSLIYRWAAAAAPWAGALAGATPLSPGTTRRLASGTLRHFIDRGALDAGGVPSLGWYRPFPPLVQSYSGPASPYWNSLGFLGLLLPADHPCWTAVEEPLPVERADCVRSLAAPGFVLSATVADGIVRVANHGSDNHPSLTVADDPHYARFAYSTATGPAAGPSATIPDNHVALIRDDGGYSRRTRIHRLRCRSGYAASFHNPVWPDGTPSGARIETASVLTGPYELRAHLVHAPTGLDLLDTGWQVAHTQPPAAQPAPRPPLGTAVEPAGAAAVATGAGLSSAYLPLHGIDGTGTALMHGASAFAAESGVPYGTARRTGDRTVHVALHTLRGARADRLGDDGGAVRCEVEETVAGAVVTAGLPDGSTVVVVLGSVPAVRAEFAGLRPVWFARRTNTGDLVVVVA